MKFPWRVFWYNWPARINTVGMIGQLAMLPFIFTAWGNSVTAYVLRWVFQALIFSSFGWITILHRRLRADLRKYEAAEKRADLAIAAATDHASYLNSTIVLEHRHEQAAGARAEQNRIARELVAR